MNGNTVGGFREIVSLSHPQHLVSKFILRCFPHNGKWVRFHQGQSWCNTFYLNNCSVRLEKTEDEENLRVERVKASFYYPEIVIYLRPAGFDVAKRKLDEFFKDKKSVYTDIRPPYRIEAKVSPFDDFLLNLLNERGTCIQYGKDLKSHKQGERNYHIFSPEVFGLNEEEYLSYWEKGISDFFEKTKFFASILDGDKPKVFNFEIEAFTQVIVDNWKHCESHFKELIEEQLGDNKKVTVCLAKKAPTSKPYKEMSLLLTIYIEEKQQNTKGAI